jgi:hypothetical protein
MISASSATLDQLNQSQTITATPSCLIEYNMNSIIDGVTVTNTGGDTKNPAGDSTPFLKLFPITTIIDPRRPKIGGIKYFVMNSSVQEPTLAYSTSSSMPYRLYYPGEKTTYKYWISNRASGNTLNNANITVSYPQAKTAATNKIVIKFEVSHSKPTAWTVSLNGTTISTNAVVPDSGVVELYYNGSAWSTTAFTTPTTPVAITSLNINVTSIDVANSYLGVIEVSARYIQDVTNYLNGFTVTKQASNGTNGLMPVGDVTSNSLSLELICYGGYAFDYDKTFPFDSSKINLFKNVKVIPSITLNGTDKAQQGIYYIDSFTLSEFGEVTITALDGAKFLQEIITPDILIEDSNSQAIIRRLLDGVGFTNYNFNTATKDSSTIAPYYWFTDDTKTVWQLIQDLCKDTQMIATFDEFDTLQFYTREWLFDNTKSTNYKFRYNANGSNLPNIVSMSKEDVPSSKAVKVNYSAWSNSSYANSSDPLYQQPVTWLGAGALTQTLPQVAPAETDASLGVVHLEYIPELDNSFSSKSGYIAINHEIIEYDAVQYQYVDITEYNQAVKDFASTGIHQTIYPKNVWITADIDLAKYQSLSKPMSFKVTGNLRIKTRNAFNILDSTSSSYAADMTHTVDVPGILGYWTTSILDTKAKAITETRNLISLDSGDSSNNKVPKSFLCIKPPTSGTHTLATTTAKLTGSTEAYALGTNMFFPVVYDGNGKATGVQTSIGAIAFSLSSDSKTGYILEIGTQISSANKDLAARSVQLYRLDNGVKTVLTDSQKDQNSAIQNIVGGSLYKVDIKAERVFNSKTLKYGTAFKIMIDNALITASDSSSAQDSLPITDKIGLGSISGNTYYDYVYSLPITDTQFKSNDTYNLYAGFLGSNSYLVQKFGKFVLNKGTETQTAAYLEEFGPVARELKYIEAKYTSRPGIPKYAIITLNPNVTLVGSSLDSFGMKAYILNNTSAPIPLADDGVKRFQVIGDAINPGDTLTYLDPAFSGVIAQDQIAFDSLWIQKESEAKALSDWMKTQWSKQQSVITMESFSNPLLQMGDIVEISYPSNSLYSSEDTVPSGYSVAKYIVLDITQTWQDGLTTSVVARSIYIP